MNSSYVRPISKDTGIFGGGEKHRVQLSDGVFAYEKATSAELTCAYFPERDICVSHAHRFDGRRLIMGVSAPLLAMAIGLPLVFGVEAAIGDKSDDLALSIMMLVFFVVFGLSFVFTAVQVVRFFLRQRTTNLCVDTEEGMREFEFWHPKGKSRDLDEVVERLSVNHPGGEESPAPNILLAHDWSFTRPIRTALKVMIAAFFVVLMAARVLERVYDAAGLGDIPTPVAIGILLLISTAGLVSYSFSSYRLAHAEPGHRTALMHFINRDYDQARKDIDLILDAQPEDMDALSLAVHIRLRQGNREGIAPYCRKIDELDPEMGAKMFLRIMQVWDINSNATVDGA